MQRQMRMEGMSALSEGQNRRLEAKNRARIASNQVLEMLGRDSDLTVSDLRDLRGKFAAVTAKNGTPELDRDQFRAIMYGVAASPVR